MKLPIATYGTVGREIFALARKFAGEFVFVMLIQLVVAASVVVTPWIIGTTFDAVSSGAGADVIRKNVTILIIAVVVQSLTAWYGDYRSRVLGQKMFHELRVDLVRTVTHLPLSTVEEAGTGDLLGRTTTDVDRVEFIVRVGISRIMVLALTVVATVVAALAMDWKLGIVLLSAFIPVAYVIRKYLRRTVAAYLAVSALSAEISGDITETVEQSETVDSLGMADHRLSRTTVLLDEDWENERYTGVMRAFFSFGMVLVLWLPVLGVVLWGAWLVGLSLTTVGAVVGVALYAQQLRAPLDELGWWIDEFQFAMVALARIFGVAEVPLDRTPGRNLPTSADVAVEDVNFAYRDGFPVLKGVSLKVKPGERLAIVGPSGAGKSTLGRLIAGVSGPDSGRIATGGVDVMTIPEDQLHSAVALVTQENHVFVGTIADNLRFAAPQATNDELWQALDTVDARWVRHLDDGLESKVGSGEHQLAPAEAQQLALARIVLLDPDVLILDEATSLLDPTAARSTERALLRVLEGRTVISIAHRLYTAFDADRVAVMIDGEVKELGTHHELVALGGEYASLWETWQQD